MNADIANYTPKAGDRFYRESSIWHDFLKGEIRTSPSQKCEVISVEGDRAAAVVNGVAYWFDVEHFCHLARITCAAGAVLTRAEEAEKDESEKSLAADDKRKLIEWRAVGTEYECGGIPNFVHLLSFELVYENGVWNLRGEIGRKGCLIRSESCELLKERAERYARAYLRDSKLLIDEVSRMESRKESDRPAEKGAE